jgi:HK97 family phage prohead protease
MAVNERTPVIRAIQPGPQVRQDDGSVPTLYGHFAVFNRWTEIDSVFEGNFLERIAPGAFRKTFRENRDRIKALFQHGKDPQVGDKPIGRIEELREDETGAYYEVGLYDGVPDLVMGGLRDGQYGASFRFQVMREERHDEVEASEDNPRALPERTLKELRLFEFGPVTFPAYADATAGVRSLTDRFVFQHLEEHPEIIRAVLELDLSPPGDDAPADTDAGTTTSDQARRETRDYLAREEVPAWQL